VLESKRMAHKPHLFGTDGVRGVAGSSPLDTETVWKLGRAIGSVVGREQSVRAGRVVLGEDTRESSAWISRALAAGLQASGWQVIYAGVITTPGVAFLARDHGFAAGIVVSASHNPFEDNGIKVLGSSGMKLAERVELEIEREVAQGETTLTGGTDRPLEVDDRLVEDYIEYLVSLAGDCARLAPLRLVIDCAHGAASRIAPKVLERLGVRGHVLHARPNGRNINQGCGSLHPESMAEATRSFAVDLGVAFDGDADRAIFATRHGRLADGDHVLYACGLNLHQRDQLKGGAVVGTLMSNLGLELALARHGLGLKRTPVGDKYVLEEMLRAGINLGGEPSGHIIFSDISPAGDGLITMLQLLRLIGESGQPLEELVRGLKQFPQIIRNVRVRVKPPLDSLPQVAEAIAQCRGEFGDHGRIVVRYSGTEKLARVMVEAEDLEAVERHATRIGRAIEAAIGAEEP